MSDNPSWYDKLCAHEWIAENPFAQAIYAPRTDPMLHAWLRSGGSLCAFLASRSDLPTTTQMEARGK